MNYCKYVNVFQGNGEIDLPRPEGVAATWHFIKALSGNTLPGAAVPFGKFTCCAYSGGYSSGYGNHAVNCGESVPRFTDGNRIKGLSHIHNSGTGALGLYWNYCVTTPFFGELANSQALNHIAAEEAVPGYYCAVMRENLIKCETTVTEKIAVHHYTFPKDGGRISIDISANGLDRSMEREWHHPEEASIALNSASLEAVVVMEGVELFVYAEINAELTASSLWEGDTELDVHEKDFDGSRERFGVVFSIEGESAELRLAISTKDMDTAKRQVFEEKRAFLNICHENYALWNEYLGAIKIESDDDTEKEIFYSNFYHSLIKPCDWSGESYFYDDEDFVIDFVTLWDQYKTQLPLVFSLYPDITRKIVNTYINFAAETDLLPHTLCLTSNLNIEAKQARMLAVYMLADAYFRDNSVADLNIIIDAMMKELSRSEFSDFRLKGECAKTTHTLDMAEGCAVIAELAENAGDERTAEGLRPLAANWVKAFDETTGLLKEDSDYYEGNHWNYSFRPMHDMDSRIALCGGAENFIALLDKFFGFCDEEDISARFEGFNNETDMEAPYAYLYAGRHDRLAEVIDLGRRYMFTRGRGGLPGNNDSGGLSSCYMWNCIGLFPISGQDVMLIGTPKYRRVTMTLANGNNLKIVKNGEGIYVKNVRFNGKEIADYRITAAEMMSGGLLEIDTELSK